MEQTPHPSHLDQTDPANADVRDIREEADREIDAYARDLHDLVLLMPEDRWDEFVRLAQDEVQEEEGGVRYRGVLFRRAPVTAVVAQEGF
ncbi:hypothetical protein [Phenylobacterium sp.]|jgi:hypothetical protein|uniref:hypothetical protein n=1 Tax=Phenylobacterium sp. TaxID=1871053 RepID=UPI002F92579C